jgi:hypothetical protein
MEVVAELILRTVGLRGGALASRSSMVGPDSLPSSSLPYRLEGAAEPIANVPLNA